MIDRCRKWDEVGEKIEQVIDGCSVSAYFGRNSQLEKIIHQQTAKKYKLLDRKTPPYCRHKPEGARIR
jgi:hypothetical protein